MAIAPNSTTPHPGPPLQLYLAHFGLKEAPFSLTPDTAYFYPHRGAQAAFNTLQVALHTGEGFIKIVGEVGCGKTLLCRRLLASLGADFISAYIPNPNMGADDILLALCDELGLTIPTHAGNHRILTRLRRCLVGHAQQGKRVVLCIDEAQSIPLPTLESLRLLSNLETEKQKLLQIVLFGQPELDDKLARPEIRQLQQRITFSDYLSPLTPHDLPTYLSHRLQVAGAAHESLFTPAAIQSLARYSNGVPRLTNIIAHKALMLAYGEGVSEIQPRHIEGAAIDTPAARTPSLKQRLRGWVQRHHLMAAP
ncbi:MAG: AAA family ATPase [Betaproteobacteria bacterium]|nr:AAA family ATPase [Betaproteobacteria bacterium]